MKKVMILLFTALLIISCSEKPDYEIPEIASYFPLTVGNYWIYDHYKVKGNGEESLQEELKDSIYISGDTIIDAKKYFIVKGSLFILGRYTGNRQLIVRDSSGYIIDDKGAICLSSVSFNKSLNEKFEIRGEYDTLYHSSISMNREPRIVSVSAGEFNVINCQNKVVDYTHNKQIRYFDNLFAENIGEILDAYTYLSDKDDHYEKRLVRYHLNE